MNTRFFDMEGSEDIHEYSRGMGNPANVFIRPIGYIRGYPLSIFALSVYIRVANLLKNLCLFMGRRCALLSKSAH